MQRVALGIAILAYLSVHGDPALGQGVPLIKKLTSQKAAENIAKEIPPSPVIPKRRPERNIPSELKVHSLGVGLGQTYIRGDLGDHGQDKITAEIFYNYSVSYSFDLMLNFHYSSHSFAKRSSRLAGTAIGIKAKLYDFDSLHPFIVGGVGFYGPQVEDKTKNVKSPFKIAFGIHFGGGGELILNRKFSLGLLAHYHNPFDIQHKMAPDVEGHYLKLLLMTLYRF